MTELGCSRPRMISPLFINQPIVQGLRWWPARLDRDLRNCSIKERAFYAIYIYIYTCLGAPNPTWAAFRKNSSASSHELPARERIGRKGSVCAAAWSESLVGTCFTRVWSPTKRKSQVFEKFQTYRKECVFQMILYVYNTGPALEIQF